MKLMLQTLSKQNHKSINLCIVQFLKLFQFAADMHDEKSKLQEGEEDMSKQRKVWMIYVVSKVGEG